MRISVPNEIKAPVMAMTQADAVAGLVERFISPAPDDAHDQEHFWDRYITTQEHITHTTHMQFGAAQVAQYFITQQEVLQAKQPVDEATLSGLLVDPLWTRERNPFWQMNKQFLEIIVQSSIAATLAADGIIENKQADMYEYAFHLKNRALDIFPAIIYRFWDSIPNDNWVQGHQIAVQQYHRSTLAMQQIAALNDYKDWVKTLE